MSPFRSALSLCAAALLALPALAGAQTCPDEAPLQWYSGGGMNVCPCFAAGEEAGAVFDAPAAHYPIQIIKVGIGWASQFGGTGQTLEQSIHVYGAGLPDPGPRLYSLDGPVLTDGAINEFNLESQLGTVTVNSGPFAVTLEFASANAGQFSAPSVVSDGNGCTSGGKNLIKAIPGGWVDACTQGLSGDWIFYVIYRQADCQTGVGEEQIAASTPAFLGPPSPNPFRGSSHLEFFLAQAGPAEVSVYALDGRKVAGLAGGDFAPGTHPVSWDGRDAAGARAPAGIYFVQLRAAGVARTQKLLLVN